MNYLQYEKGYNNILKLLQNKLNLIDKKDIKYKKH